MSKKKGAYRHSSKTVHKNHNLNSFIHQSTKLPAGIKILVVYTGVIVFFYLLYLIFGATQPVSIFFGKLLYGAPATVLEMISLLLLITIIYGLVKKHYWVFWLSLSWFIFGVLNALVSLTTFNAEFDVLKNVLVTSSYVVILLNGIIAWYIYSEKEYFKVKHLNKETKAKDKFFVYIISVALIVSLLFLATFGLNFYNSTLKTVHNLVSELKESGYPELACAKKMGSEKDLCYLILTVANENKSSHLCDNIESDFYKMTCYRSLQ